MNPFAIALVGGTLYGIYKNWGTVQAKIPALKKPVTSSPIVTATKSVVASGVQRATLPVTKPAVQSAVLTVPTITITPDDTPAIDTGSGLTADSSQTSPDELPPADV